MNVRVFNKATASEFVITDFGWKELQKQDPQGRQYSFLGKIGEGKTTPETLPLASESEGGEEGDSEEEELADNAGQADTNRRARGRRKAD